MLREAGFTEKTLKPDELLHELTQGNLARLPPEVRRQYEQMVRNGHIASAHHFTLREWTDAFQEKVKNRSGRKNPSARDLEDAVIAQFKAFQKRHGNETPIQKSLFFNRPQGHGRVNGPLELVIFRSPKSRLHKLFELIFGT